MRVIGVAVAGSIAAFGAAAGMTFAPVAGADSCDPAVTICEGGDTQTSNTSPDYSPAVSTDDQYPLDGDWYFNPAGGGTVLQPEHLSGGGGASGGGGGGGHR
jgi:hypothetical protein